MFIVSHNSFTAAVSSFSLSACSWWYWCEWT